MGTSGLFIFSYNELMDCIKAKVFKMTTVSMHLKFGVHITGPVEMPPFVVEISMQEILAHSQSQHEDYIRGRVYETVLLFYNKRVEDSPLLDMFDDPDRFKRLYKVQLETVEGTGLEPVTPTASTWRSTN